jgi:nitroreductase
MVTSRSAKIDDSSLRECVGAAVAAASVHNTQPWLFRLRDDGLDVFVDRDRQLRTLDPTGREMFVSVGAAILNLRVALQAQEYVVTCDLMPDPDDPDLAARVRIIGRDEPSLVTVLLADSIPRRHTNRRPFAERVIPDQTLDALAEAAAAEGVMLMVADDILREGVLSLTRTAENRLRRNRHYRAEIARWTTAGGVGRKDGVPRQALGPRDRDEAIPLRDLAVGHGTSTTIVTFESHPTILLLLTADDSEADWLRVGAALQRVLLTATVNGLAATPLTQLTEVPVLRELLCDRPTGKFVQTVLRVGYPLSRAVATPRRDIDDVIVAGTRPTR